VDFFRGLPFPLAVGALFVIVLLRAGGTYALGRAARSGAGRTARVQRLVDSPRFVRAQDLVSRWGAPIVVFSFLTVGFQTLANLAAGVGKMPLRRYLPALVIGGLIWAVLYATVGLITFAALTHLYETSPVGAILGGLALLAGLVVYIVWQVRRRHATSAPESTPDVVSAPQEGAERG
jgi:membrane protein DedA with SNARE-associated domain